MCRRRRLSDMSIRSPLLYLVPNVWDVLGSGLTTLRWEQSEEHIYGKAEVIGFEDEG